MAIGALAATLAACAPARSERAAESAQSARAIPADRPSSAHAAAPTPPAPAGHGAPVACGEAVPDIGASSLIVFQDRQGNRWFGSDGEGVYRYDGKSVTRFTMKLGLCNDSIRGIQQHTSGDILVTTLGGVSRFDGTSFTTLPVVEMDSPDEGWVLSPDDAWLAFVPGQRGPYRYDGKALYHLRFPESPREDPHLAAHPSQPWSPYEVYCTYRDRSGRMWFGTGNLGICRFDGRSRDWMYEAHLTELENNAMFGIRSIIEDHDGAYWFCNTQYRYRMRPIAPTDPRDGQIDYVREPGIDLGRTPGESGPIYFMSVVEDRRGDLWMATYGDGVWRYDGREMTHHRIKEGDSIVTLCTISMDNAGDLWLGTHEHGAYRFNGVSFERFRPAGAE